ncbi:transposase, IS4 family protein [Desulfosarcina variabilis str. Montpellier]|uniref:IS4 family transposase n=1 Tax=Desulfosarcina variabilis TaxID=2300 RepID=UPI003AFB1573
MPRAFSPFKTPSSLSFADFLNPPLEAMNDMPELKSRGNRKLKMSFEDQLRALVFFHLEEHTSAQHLLQTLKEDDFAREHIAPEDGIEKSSFSEATNSRGLDQFMHVFQNLQAQASKILPKAHEELGNLVGIDGSLIDGTFSMLWADYRKGVKKAKVHVGLDLNQSIPKKVYLTDGNGAERPFVSKILSEGQTGVLDRGYQCHDLFDQWQQENKFYICRIKASTTKTIISQNPVPAGSIVFFDAMVLLGTNGVNQSKTPLRLVGYEVDRIQYWIATNRYDLSAEQIAQAYKLRWDIENFFAWWKRHLKVYHLIARSPHGLMVQILAGLITYLLLAIYCRKHFNEKVSIRRVRQLRTQIENELRCWPMSEANSNYGKKMKLQMVNAKV